MSVKPLQSDSNRSQNRVVLARIDNRLVHGQVLEAWLPFVQANCIIVASDEVAAKPLQRKLMVASVPSDIPLIIGTLAEIAEFFSRDVTCTRILLLFANPKAALSGYRFGIPFSELNLGNIPGGEGKHRLSCTVSLNEDDFNCFRQLESCGVRIFSRCLPSDESLDWNILDGCGSR